jgi:hypothetical protein
MTSQETRPASFDGTPGKANERLPGFALRNVRIGSRGPIGVVWITGDRITRIHTGDGDDSGPAGFDAGGRTLLPGFWDAHVHAVQWASARRRLDLTAATSAQDAADTIRSHLRHAATPAAEFIVGYGFRDALWPDTPHKSLLERAAPSQPVVLVSHDLHATWLSPAALDLVDAAAHPTGIFREQESLEITAALPQASAEEIDRWVADATRMAAARGVTGFLDFEFADNLPDWARRVATQNVATRVACAIYPPYMDAVIRDGLRTGDPLPAGHGLLAVGPAKVFVDGSLNTRTAYCHHPYPGARPASEANGLLVTPPDELAQVMRRAAAHGIQPAVHAIGDRANTIALNAFEEVGCSGRIEHAQLLSEPDIPRFARLGITAGIQPAHLLADRDVADRHWPGRTGHAFAYAELLASGARLELGSDAPVAPLDPWPGIAAATSRTDGRRSPWHPEQAIPLAAALAAASRGRAGMRAGDLADLVIVDDDPADLEPAELASMSVFGTLLGGRWTYGPGEPPS